MVKITYDDEVIDLAIRTDRFAIRINPKRSLVLEWAGFRCVAGEPIYDIWEIGDIRRVEFDEVMKQILKQTYLNITKMRYYYSEKKLLVESSRSMGDGEHRPVLNIVKKGK